MKKKTTNANPVEEADVTRIANLELDVVEISKMNPRKTIVQREIDELAESIKEQGLLQPITVRPIIVSGKVDYYEIVCGERRFRAVSQLGWVTIPAIIRPMTDAQAFDAMITENLQRKDVDPLEEGEAFQALLLRGKTSTAMEELCERFGKSENYIRGRISLTKLIPELTGAMRQDRLTLSGAVKISKLNEDQQKEFYDEHLDYDPDHSIELAPHASLSDVMSFIQSQNLELVKAPFLDNVGGEVLPARFKQPWCLACPFNSASQKTLFPELSQTAVCLNEQCYRRKSYCWQEWFLDEQMPFLRSNDSKPEAGDIVLTCDGYVGLKRENRLNDLKGAYQEYIHNMAKYSRMYCSTVSDDDKFIKAIDLAELVSGRQAWRYYYPLTQGASSSGHDKFYYTSELRRLDDRQRETVAKTLAPIFEQSFADYITELEEYPYESNPRNTVIMYALYQCVDPVTRNDEFKNVERANPAEARVTELRKWMSGDGNGLDKLIILAARGIASSMNSYQQALIHDIMNEIAPARLESVNTIEEAKFAKRKAAAIEALRALGFDARGNALPKAENRDNNKE